MRVAICGAAFFKRTFCLPSGIFAFWEDILHMVAYQEFCIDHPSISRGSLALALSTLQQKKFNYCAPTYLCDVIPNLQICTRSFVGWYLTPEVYIS